MGLHFYYRIKTKCLGETYIYISYALFIVDRFNVAHERRAYKVYGLAMFLE